MNGENDQPITLMKVRIKAQMTQKQWADWPWSYNLHRQQLGEGRNKSLA